MRPVVAFDANPVVRDSITGTELVALELALRLPALVPEADWVLYAARPAPALPLDLTVLPMRRLWSQLRLPLELSIRRPDLLFVPSHVVPFLAPGPALTIIHDLAFERFPEAYSAGTRSYLRLSTRWAERRCEVLLAVSEATKRDLVELHGIDPERVVVAHPGGGGATAGAEPAGSDPDRLAAIGLSGPFFLQVGRVERRKNQLAALAAVESLPGMRLVCAGGVHDAGIADRVRTSPAGVLLGRVPAGDLALLYRNATAVVVPSLHEGFGFPVLEAMAAGTPVVTSRRSSLPEVGGDAVLYVENPEDSQALAEALSQIGQEPLRSRLIRAGRERAAEFTWERFAGTVGDVIRGLLSPAPPEPARSSPPTATS